MVSYNYNGDESVGENPSSSTSSWISHRAYLAPTTLKRSKNTDSYNSNKNIPININKSIERSYKSATSHTSPTFNYNFNDEYDPRFPNDYEKVSKIFTIKSHTKSAPASSNVMEKPVPREKTTTIDQEQKISGDEMLKRRLEAMAKAELYSESPIDAQSKEDDLEVTFSTKLERVEPKKAQPVALKMMEKMGWKEGLGLGKNEQGMVTPLVAKQTGKHSALIVNALPKTKSVDFPKKAAEPPVTVVEPEGVKSRISLMGFSTKSDIDMDELEEIVGEYGSLVNIKLLREDEHRVLADQPECSDIVAKFPMESHRYVLCEYETEEQSERLIVALNNKKIMESRVNIHYFPLEVYKKIFA